MCACPTRMMALSGYDQPVTAPHSSVQGRMHILTWSFAFTGLQRTDNNMEFTTWPQVNMINQKNYYTYGASIFISLCFVESP